MRIFFSMAHLGSFRMYEPVLRELADRGHEIHLSIGRSDGLGWNTALDALVSDYPSITWNLLSLPGEAFWAEAARTIRLWADYLRYFHEDYASAPKLKARAEERVPARLVQWTSGRVFRRPAGRRRLQQVLRAIERALPPVPEVASELDARRPDLVLVTPLVYLGSAQFEIVRASVARGIRTALAVGSWDHLSSKALIREMPHRVLVWNQTQRDEAVRLHAVPPDRVVVTGAQCYDQWFDRRPDRTRDAFCARVGLPADRPFLLYVCSALFWGSPVEAEFVRTWVRSLRESGHPELRHASILVRPHPARMAEWASVDLSAFDNVSVFGSNPVDAGSKHDYFESLFYSSAIVGLNTSAFIEGAIVGRPVHTVLAPEFQENQEGVLHFRYLLTVGGGVLRAGRTTEEHHAQLTASLASPPERPGEGFVRAFVRPHGLDVPATPRFCDAVDDLLRAPQPRPVRTPGGYVLVRGAAWLAFQALRRIYGAEVMRDDWSRKEIERARAREASRHARAERRQRKAVVQAARVAARVQAAAARQQALAEKQHQRAAREHDRQRRKDAHRRQQRRHAWRGRIKARAMRLLPFHPGREGRGR